MMLTNAKTKQPDMTTTIPKTGRKKEAVRMNVFDSFLHYDIKTGIALKGYFIFPMGSLTYSFSVPPALWESLSFFIRTATDGNVTLSTPSQFTNEVIGSKEFPTLGGDPFTASSSLGERPRVMGDSERP